MNVHPLCAASSTMKFAWNSSKRALIVSAILIAFATVFYGQTQQTPIVPMSQGGGQATGKLQSSEVGPSAENNIGALTDRPITPGQTVHIMVFDAPPFSIVTQVSEDGNIAVPMAGTVHLAGLNSIKAAQLIEARLKKLQLVVNPNVAVTVNDPSTGITVLGEVHSPGIYQPTGKDSLSDVLASAGGLTANTGRVIEISNDNSLGKTVDIPWDPTMHDTSDYNYPIRPGDRVLVKACGIAYVGGHVSKPGAYSLCGSPTITLSEIVAMAGGISRFTSEKQTYLIRTQPNGSKTAQKFDLHKILRARAADPVIKEDDIIYVTPSPLKEALNQAVTWAMATTSTVLYVYHP